MDLSALDSGTSRSTKIKDTAIKAIKNTKAGLRSLQQDHALGVKSAVKASTIPIVAGATSIPIGIAYAGILAANHIKKKEKRDRVSKIEKTLYI